MKCSVRRTAVLALALLLVCMPGLSACAQAFEFWQSLLEEPTAEPAVEHTRIRDDADLFTAAEEAQIAQRIAQFQQNTGMDFVLMTSNRPHEGLSAAQLADDFYDYGGYGLDEENSIIRVVRGEEIGTTVTN